MLEIDVLRELKEVILFRAWAYGVDNLRNADKYRGKYKMRLSERDQMR